MPVRILSASCPHPVRRVCCHPLIPRACGQAGRKACRRWLGSLVIQPRDGERGCRTNANDSGGGRALLWRRALKLK